MAGSGQAQDVSLYVALTTDYVFRGVSYSNEQGAFQLGLDVSAENGLFGGIWASTVDIAIGTRIRSVEVDYYLGYVQHFDSDWNLSFAVNRYTYPEDGNAHYNYTEVAAIVGIRDRLWFEVDYTDSLFGSDKSAVNLETLTSWTLPASLSLTTGLGYFDISNIAGDAYWHWQVGLSRPLGWADLDLRYHDTSNVPARIGPAALSDPRIVLTLSAEF